MSATDPFSTLFQMTAGYVLARSLHAAADLGVADALDDAPRATAALAAEVGAHPDALRRVLRLLAAHGVFEVQGDMVRHSPVSRLLRSDHPRSLRAFVRMFGLPINWTMYETFGQAVRTGRPTGERALEGGFWKYFAAHPEEARIFDAAMAGKAHGQIAGVMASYDFSRFGRVGDIGGGRGHLIRAILEAVPHATGVLFDLPHVVAGAGRATERLMLQGGDFFRDALPACDAYLLMEVIHDWGDEEALAILRAVRRTAPRNATLLMIETIIPESPGPHWSKTLDIHMLTLLGGMQRTRSEYAALLERAGFSLAREIPTPGDISILEAMPA